MFIEVNEILKYMDLEIKNKIPYKIVKRRAGDLAKVFANPNKAKDELGWRAELTIEDAMADTINYLRYNRKI